MKKRLTIGLIVGATVFAAVFAAAASLGVTSDDLAAGNKIVAACQPDTDDVNVSYTTAFQNNRYEVTNVTVSGIALDSDTATPDGDGCDGQELKVALRDTVGTVVGEGTVASITTDSHTIDISPDVSAKGATDVHVLIADPVTP